MIRCTSLSRFKVAVLGAAGGIGQPLSLLLTGNPLVTELSLFDVKGAAGVAADLSHIPTGVRVKGHGADDVEMAVHCADLVLIPAGVPRKPGMTRDDLFNTNAGIVKNLLQHVASAAPKASVGIITNPVNSTLPIAAEVLKIAGVYDPRRVFGVTSLDLSRARTFVAEVTKDKQWIQKTVPVVGGHSGHTIVPLLSAIPGLSEEQVKALTHRIQFGGDEVVKAKDGAGSATLSMAKAAADFASAVLRAKSGEKGVELYAMVESPLYPSCSFFSSKLDMGKDGVEKVHALPSLNAFEKKLLEDCLKELEGNIAKGVKFVEQS